MCSVKKKQTNKKTPKTKNNNKTCDINHCLDPGDSNSIYDILFTGKKSFILKKKMLPKYIFLSILRILLKNISKKHVRSVVLFIHTIV